MTEALEILSELDRLHRITPDPIYEAYSHALGALVYLHLGDHSQALASAQIASEMMKQVFTDIFSLSTLYSIYAELTLRLWEKHLLDNATAQARAMLACTYLQRTARTFPMARPKLGLWDGLRDWQNGDKDHAHQKWQTALIEAERLKLPQDQGLIHYEMARHLAPDDPTRRDHLDEADAIFERLGLALWRDAVLALRS